MSLCIYIIDDMDPLLLTEHLIQVGQINSTSFQTLKCCTGFDLLNILFFFKSLPGYVLNPRISEID